MPTSIPQNTNLENKVILITGATGGIGRQIALHFAQMGATVILLGRIIKKLEYLYDDIMAILKHNKSLSDITNEPAIYPLNLVSANDEHFQELAQVIDKNYQRLDGLVHNAAILGNLSPIKNYTLQQWYKVMQTNVNAVFMLTHYCLPILEKSNKASVLFTSTSVAEEAKPYWGAYSVSKAASDHLMKTLALEYDELKKYSISFNSFSPGAVATRLRATAYPGEDPKTLTQTVELVPYYAYLMGGDHQLNGKIIKQSDFNLMS